MKGVLVVIFILFHLFISSHGSECYIEVTDAQNLQDGGTFLTSSFHSSIPCPFPLSPFLFSYFIFNYFFAEFVNRPFGCDGVRITVRGVVGSPSPITLDGGLTV
eukprot:TRINITY_DN6150_c0_g1_i1.p1 TRINITY_DN6150_c0_g1~~TRINITY_DN6150_c0_g1_i1.p1  ORF type:complete len:104 (+),score=11.34 TRINITY_DN6150_c0_g1_i1:218-529(+)